MTRPRRVRHPRVHLTKGPRLHARRIAHTGGTGAIRTIKYPLIGRGEHGYAAEQSVIDAVISDNLAIYGAQSLPDLLDEHHTGTRAPSFVGFWLLSLAYGAVFGAQNAIADHLARLSPAPADTTVVDSLDALMRPLVDPVVFTDFISRAHRNSAKGVSENAAAKPILDTVGFSRVLNQVTGEIVQKTPAGLDTESADQVWSRVEDYLTEVRYFDEATGVWRYVPPEDQFAARRRFFGMAPEAPLVSEATNTGVKIGYGFDPAFVPDEFVTTLTESGATAFFDTYTTRVAQTRATFDPAKEVWVERWKDAWPGTLGLAANGNSFNAVFALATSLKVNGPLFVLDQMSTKFGWGEAERAIVLPRLHALATYAHDLPEKPRLVATWTDYRVDVYGTLSSWWSNRDGKLKATRAGLAAVEKASHRLLTDVLVSEDSEHVEPVRVLREALSELREVTGNPEATRQLVDALELAQAKARVAHNDLRQQHDAHWKRYFATASPGEDEDNQAPALFATATRRVQRPPLFFGETAQARAAKDFQWRTHLAAAMTRVADVLASITPSTFAESVEARTVAGLARAAHQVNPRGEVATGLAALETAMGCRFADEGPRASFNPSPYAARPRERLHFHPLTWEEIVATLGISAHWHRLLGDVTAHRPVDHQVLRDLVAITRVVVSALATTQGRTLTERACLDLAFSDIAGIRMRIGRTRGLSRYQAQSTNGAQSVLGRSHVRLNNDGQTIGARYHYLFPKAATGGTPSVEIEEFASGAWKPWQTSRANADSHVWFDVCSSRNQVQFLNYLSVHTGLSSKFRDAWNGVDLKVLGGFAIAEQDLLIDWSGQHPVVTRLNNPPTLTDMVSGENTQGRRRNDMKKRRRRLYVSQPFELVPPAGPAAGSPPDTRRNQFWRFMGVDIGAYALTWTILEATVDPEGRWRFTPADDPQRPGNPLCGELIEPGHRLIAERVRKDRSLHATRTFTSPSTYTERLRATVATSYRNRLHALALTHQAIVVFESDIERFESAGRAISTLYATLKRADERPQKNTSAHDADRRHTWGKSPQANAGMAVVVAPAGTSQTCTACGRWWSKTTEPDAMAPIRSYTGGGTVNHTTPQAAVDAKASGRIKDAMRPRFDHVSAAPARNLYGSEAIQAFNARRGNSALFICPFVDCQHVSDADLQASVLIGIRGAVKFLSKQGLLGELYPAPPQEKEKEGGKKYTSYPVDWYVAMLNQFAPGRDYPTVPLFGRPIQDRLVGSVST